MEETIEKTGSSKPTKTWFIERTGDGHIFATDEGDAWNMLTNKSKWVRHDFKIVGVSNGQTYFKIMGQGKQEMQEILDQRKQLEVTYQKYSSTEDRLRFTELKDDSDEMVQKVTKILSDLSKQIAEIDSKIKNFNQHLTNKAFNAELEIARGKIEFPSNHDIITPVSSDREKILSNLRV